jgi:hypothetical protein
VSTIVAIIDERSPVYTDALRIFGSRRVPLIDAQLVRGAGPALTSDELFFKVDWQRMTDDQVDGWAKWMATKFGLRYEDVLLDMHDPQHGIPLRQVHVLKLEPEGTAPVYPRGLQFPKGAIDARLFH